MMSEQTTIEVGSEVIVHNYDTGYQDVRTTVQSISILNGRRFASLRVGQRAILVYVNDLIPAAPALDSQAELIALRAERDALIAALREARDSLLDIRDLSAPYDCRDNPPGFELSRIFSHAEYGLRHSEAAANKHGMEKGDKP